MIKMPSPGGPEAGVTEPIWQGWGLGHRKVQCLPLGHTASHPDADSPKSQLAAHQADLGVQWLCCGPGMEVLAHNAKKPQKPPG